jgi:membrane protein
VSALKDRATRFLDRARVRSRLLDHAIKTQQHYGSVKGSYRAAAVTYYAFLSFFPILAIAFFVVGSVASVFPDAQDNLVTALESVLPGLIGDGPEQISLDAVQQAARTVGVIGLAVLVYSGLGWTSCMRDALNQVFEAPRTLQPGFVVGKLRDLVTLAVIGVIMVVSVAVSGLVMGFSRELLDLLGLDQGLAPELALLVVVLGGAADILLFFAIFTLLVRPRLPRRSLWAGALLGAIGAELLKWLSSFLIGLTRDQPAFQAFGIALILLVWINYFSRVVVYAAAWAFTTVPRGAPTVEPTEPVAAVAAVEPYAPTARERRTPPDVPPSAWVGSGAALMLALVALLRRRKQD